MTPAPTTEQIVEVGLRSSLLGIVINLTLAMVKCLTGIFGHSFALLADGVESFLDVISSSVVYWGLRLAIKPLGAGVRVAGQDVAFTVCFRGEPET